MATEMTLNEYQTEAARTARMDLPPREKLATFALGLGGEAGEVQDLIKKHIGHSHDLDLEKIEKEIGDVLWYVAALAGMLGLNLGDVASANLDKLRARYPEGFDPARSRARKAEIESEIDRRDRADADTIAPAPSLYDFCEPPGPGPIDANGSPVVPESIPLMTKSEPSDTRGADQPCYWYDDAFRWRCATCGGSEAFGANKTEPKRCYKVDPSEKDRL